VHVLTACTAEQQATGQWQAIHVMEPDSGIADIKYHDLCCLKSWVKPPHTFKSGTKSGPSGVSTLTRVVCTFQVPRNSSGKVRSEGPPPKDDQALSTASGNRLAYANTAAAEKQSGTQVVHAQQLCIKQSWL